LARTSDPAFGGEWDSGQFVVDQLLSLPISQMLRDDAKRAGIDLSNPRRSVAALLASGLMGTVVGNFLGPFGSLVGGLLGESLALTAKYPGDRDAEQRRRERQAAVALRVKALQIASEVTKDHVSAARWNSIVDEYQRRVDSLGDSTSTEEEALEIAERIISGSMRAAGHDVYANFDKVYAAARRELGE
jgi:hypothetical protein